MPNPHDSIPVTELLDLIDTKFSLPFSEEPNGITVLITAYFLLMQIPVFVAIIKGKYSIIPVAIGGAVLRCMFSVIPIAGVLMALAHLLNDLQMVLNAKEGK